MGGLRPSSWHFQQSWAFSQGVDGCHQSGDREPLGRDLPQESCCIKVRQPGIFNALGLGEGVFSTDGWDLERCDLHFRYLL
jgi:hypothetical protein